MNNFNTGDKVYTIGDIDRLERENAELKAQVEQLRSNLKSLLVRYDNGAACIDTDGIELGNAFRFDDGEFNRLSKLVDSTPAQCLAEVKVQAGRNGYFEGYTDALNIQSSNLAESLAEEYADQLRQATKAGE